MEINEIGVSLKCRRLQNIMIPCCWSSSWADPESTSKCASNRPAGTEFGKMTYEKPLSNFPSTRSVCTGSLVTGLSVVTIDSIEAILLLDTERDLPGTCCNWRPWCLTKWCLFPYMLKEFTTLHILAIHARRAINRLITLVLLTRWLDYQTKVMEPWKRLETDFKKVPTFEFCQYVWSWGRQSLCKARLLCWSLIWSLKVLARSVVFSILKQWCLLLTGRRPKAERRSVFGSVFVFGMSFNMHVVYIQQCKYFTTCKERRFRFMSILSYSSNRRLSFRSPHAISASMKLGALFLFMTSFQMDALSTVNEEENSHGCTLNSFNKQPSNTLALVNRAANPSPFILKTIQTGSRNDFSYI